VQVVSGRIVLTGRTIDGAAFNKEVDVTGATLWSDMFGVHNITAMSRAELKAFVADARATGQFTMQCASGVSQPCSFLHASCLNDNMLWRIGGMIGFTAAFYES